MSNEVVTIKMYVLVLSLWADLMKVSLEEIVNIQFLLQFSKLSFVAAYSNFAS